MMEPQLITSAAVAAFAVLWGFRHWATDTPHIAHTEWLDGDLRQTARVTIYKWYAPWVRHTAVVCKHHSLEFIWYFVDEHGHPTDVTVPSKISSRLVNLRKREEELARISAREREEQRQRQFWTDAKRAQLPQARVVDEDH